MACLIIWILALWGVIWFSEKWLGRSSGQLGIIAAWFVLSSIGMLLAMFRVLRHFGVKCANCGHADLALELKGLNKPEGYVESDPFKCPRCGHAVDDMRI